MAEEKKNKFECGECLQDFPARLVSPAVIDDKLILICSKCWEQAVAQGRAAFYPDEEMTDSSELWEPD